MGKILPPASPPSGGSAHDVQDLFNLPVDMYPPMVLSSLRLRRFPVKKRWQYGQMCVCLGLNSPRPRGLGPQARWRELEV